MTRVGGNPTRRTDLESYLQSQGDVLSQRHYADQFTLQENQLPPNPPQHVDLNDDDTQHTSTVHSHPPPPQPPQDADSKAQHELNDEPIRQAEHPQLYHNDLTSRNLSPHNVNQSVTGGATVNEGENDWPLLSTNTTQKNAHHHGSHLDAAIQRNKERIDELQREQLMLEKQHAYQTQLDERQRQRDVLNRQMKIAMEQYTTDTDDAVNSVTVRGDDDNQRKDSQSVHIDDEDDLNDDDSIPLREHQNADNRDEYVADHNISHVDTHSADIDTTGDGKQRGDEDSGEDDDKRVESGKPDYYDENEDDVNESWVQHNLMYTPDVQPSSSSQSATRASIDQFGSDAVLVCPQCFAPLTYQSQQHSRYKNQFRSLFVTSHVKVDKGHSIRPTATTDDEKNVRFYAAYCADCGNQVGAYQQDASREGNDQESYHFFNAAATPMNAASSAAAAFNSDAAVT